MASISFVLKDKNADKSLVVMAVRYGKSNRVNYSTKEKINPAYWLQSEKRAKRTDKFEGYRAFNNRLKDYEVRTEKVLREIQNNGYTLNNKLIKKELDIEFSRSKSKIHNLVEFCTQKVALIPFKGQRRKPQSLRPYHQLAALLLEYNKLYKAGIEFVDIDMDFYKQFLKFLSEQKGFTLKTIGKHIKTLKAAMRLASDENLHKNTVYEHKNFEPPTETVDNIYLTDAELQQIYETDLTGSDKNLSWTRDLFLIQANTGLRYSDLHKISNDAIKDGLLTIRTEKTDEEVIIPLNAIVLQIMAKYGKELPAPYANPVMNRHLKEIGKLAQINDPIIMRKTLRGERKTIKLKKYELITTHTARRSFASNMYKIGVPTLSIMAITGHRTEKAFLTYIKISKKEHAEMMRTVLLQNYSPLKMAK